MKLITKHRKDSRPEKPKWELVRVLRNDYASITIHRKRDSAMVQGTGMLQPRFFQNVDEAVEFAQDKMLMITLEIESDLDK